MSFALASLVALAASTSTASDVVVIVDDDDPFDAAFSETATAGGDVLELSDEPWPSEDFSVTARATASLDLRVGVDTSFERPTEQVGELSMVGNLVLEVDLTPELRVFAAPRLAWLGGLDRGGGDREVLIARAPEAFLGWASGPLSVRAGYLVFDWGQSELFAPSDALNPPDLRRGASMVRDDLAIPVPAVEIVGAFGPLTVRGVVEPVFTPGRFFLTGWDLSAMQGGLLPAGPTLGASEVLEPAYVDQLGDQLLATERPRDRPDNATLGLRAQLTLDAIDLAATVVHGWNPFPSVTVDPSLVTIAGAWAEAAARGETPSFDDPALAGALVDLQRALESGAPVFKGKYERRTIVGFDAAWALDPVILEVDVAYSTRQVSYTAAGQARPSPALTGVLGLEYYRGESLQLWVEGFLQHLFDVPGTDPVAYIEAASGPRAADRGVTWGGVGAFLRYQIWAGDLAFELGTLVTSRRDLALLPRIEYRLAQHHHGYLGGVLVEGQGDGVGGAYTHLDQLFLGYRLSY